MVTPDELDQKAAWIQQNLLQEQAPPPFSFILGGQTSAMLLPAWQRQVTAKQRDDQRTEHTLSWSDAKTGLLVRCVAVEYADYPVVEWTVYLKNTGSAATAILSDVRALDIHLERPPEQPGDVYSDGTEFILRHHTGDLCREYSYAPQRTRMEPGTQHRFAPIGGRPSNGTLPYFSLQSGDGGMLLAIGWPGQWLAQFTRDAAMGLQVVAGQERTHFQLLPGEEARTPLIALLFWRGDPVRAQNVWRRWMVAHNLPRPGGALPRLFLSACMGLKQNEKDENEAIDQFDAERSGLQVWWMDAGWYEQVPDGWGWDKVGTWEPDPVRFPRGIRGVSDHAHARGMQYVLWFEPERVSPGTAWAERPEWLLRLRPQDAVFRNEQNMREQAWVDHEAQRNQIRDGDALFNLGIPAACDFLTEFISHKIEEFGLDVYRQDFNIGPLKFWEAADAPDRQGMTENHYVAGLLQFWDELRRRYPNVLIDTCASGGRRIDLETLRRAVPLLRSDYTFEPIGHQAHAYGLASWVPYYGTGVTASDPYTMRSSLTPTLGMTVDRGNWDMYRRMSKDWQLVADCFYGDYYPLTIYSVSPQEWIAWQFDRPDLGKGMVQAFRRPASPFEAARFRMRGLRAECIYRITDLDIPDDVQEMTGKELMETGLPVRMTAAPQAIILMYQCKQAA